MCDNPDADVKIQHSTFQQDIYLPNWPNMIDYLPQCNHFSLEPSPPWEAQCLMLQRNENKLGEEWREITESKEWKP